MPGDHQEGPPTHARRKILVAGGFVAANALVLARMPGGRPATTTSVPADDSPARPVGIDAPATETQDPPALTEAEPEPGADEVHDLVLAGGRVIDPDSGFDDVANVGIDGGTITALSREPLQGREVLDVAGLVVAPGFIDILSYDPNPYGIWYKVGDGVTTNLGMHGIDAGAEEWFERYASDYLRPPTHYGGAFDSPFHRNAALSLTPADTASRRQRSALAELAEAEVAAGWIGIDVEPEYTPEVDEAEISALGRVAARAGVPLLFHARYSDPDPPGTNAEAIAEVLRVARATEAAVHIQHITSTGGTYTMPETLATLDQARADGLAVTACLYPYDFWATTLASPRFAEGWQERFRIDYSDLEIAGTGERLTERTFARYQAENKLAAAHAIPEKEVELALRAPWTMIGSDAILEEGNNNHPRSTGAFCRTLGVYVREREVINLMDALAKMTILPARLLEGGAPALRRKGRLQRGADADITVFDPARVEDRSTVADPAQMSAGIEWVIVDGQIVLDPSGPRDDVKPGKPIRSG